MDPRRSYVIRAVCGYAVLALLWIFFSDRILASITDGQTMAVLSTVKGVFFVLVTSILLWIALRNLPASDAQTPPRQLATDWAPIAVFAGAALAILAIAHVAYRAQASSIERDALTKLEAQSRLEVDAVTRWYETQNRVADAMAHDPGRRDLVRRWLETGSLDDQTHLTTVLATMRNDFQFRAVTLVGRDGRRLLGDVVAHDAEEHFREAVMDAASSGEVRFLDLHRHEDESIHMAFLAPMAGVAPGGDTVVAVFDVAPETWLYPYLAKWPAPSKTGENVLVRRDGDGVVNLNDNKRGTGSALRGRRALTDPDQPAARHFRNGETSMSGVDYRGNRVLAAMATIPATGWTLISKIDEAEALAEFQGLAIGTGLSIAVALVACFGLAFLLWQRQRLDAAYREIAQRHQVEAAEQRFRSTFEQAAVGLAHVSLDGRWIWFNPRFSAIAGYDESTLMRIPVVDVLHPDERGDVRRSLTRLARGDVDRLQSERRVVHADGTILWVSMTASIVRETADTVPYVVVVAEDVSGRRTAEDALRASEERFELAMRGSTDGLWDWDLVQGGVYYSPRWAAMLGYTLDELDTGYDTWRSLVHPDDLSDAERRIREVTEGQSESLSLEFRLRTRNGDWRDILSRGFAVRAPDGRALRMIGTHTDITDRKRDEADLRRAAAVFTNTQEAVVITDAVGRVVDINPAFTTITGWTRDETLGASLAFLQSGRHDRAFYAELWRTIAISGHWQGEIWNKRRSGEVFPAWLNVSSVRDESGRVVNHLGTFVDIGPLKQSEARLAHLAHHDPLTDLPNRILLLEELDRAVDRAVTEGGTGAVLFLDLDRFKNVNDSLGHAAGDELLWLVSLRLRRELPEGAMLARLGGDEFVGLIGDVGDHDGAATLAARLIERLDQPFVLADGQEIFISTSIGVSLFPADGVVANELIQHADAALYEAKGAGRATHRFYEEVLTTAAAVRLETEAGLRRALERDEFELHYQPLVSAADGRIRGVEALLRWRDPLNGLIPPDRFIPIAEETGLIIAIGEWVLRDACRQMRAWLDAGLKLDTLAVNLSAREFQRADVPRRIAEVLAETGVPAHCLELEITEGALMDQGSEAERRLAALKQMGVRLAIDDFGTGWSSLAYLRRLPIDKLKIDRSFVNDMPGDPTSVEIASAIISLARNLKLEVLAEGVETRAQFDELVRLGCDMVQGWYFSRALPAADIPAMLGQTGLIRTNAGRTPRTLRYRARRADT